MTHPKKPKANQSIQIYAEEQKSNDNKELVSFDMVAQLSESSNTYFFIVYKTKEVGKKVHYVPIYKSETRKAMKEGIYWNKVMTGCTDLCNDSNE